MNPFEKNDLINMEYSKLMTIIENTKVKLEKEEEIKETTDFFMAAPSTTTGIATLRQKLREKQQKEFRKTKNLTNEKKAEISNILSKKVTTSNNFGNNSSSFLLINSSSFEIDNQAIKDRSLSMYLKDESIDENLIQSRVSLSQHSFNGLTPSEKAALAPFEKNETSENEKEEEKLSLKEKDREKEKKPSMIRSNTDLYKKPVKKRKKEKIVVNKRFMYYDNEGF